MPLLPILAARIARRYYRTYGRLPRLFPPHSYSEKIQYRKLFDRRPYLTETSDKFAMRAYAAGILGKDLTPELYFRTTDPTSIPFDSLPTRFVVKATHGSGWQWIVRDRDTLDRTAVIAACEKWLRSDYSTRGDEPFYAAIPHQIIVEELLDDGMGNSPADIKILVFNQRVRVVQLDSNRFGAHRRNFFDEKWNQLPIYDRFGRLEGVIEPPTQLGALIECAEALARDTDFVRVDCYQVGERIYLGELTHCPGTGLSPLIPAIWDDRFGEMWKLDRC
jgi:teichuronopeptide biosynthesis TupA-like protein